MNIQEKRDFLINCLYWALVAAGVYLGLEYLLPIALPVLFGILIAWLVVWISGKLKTTNKILRILLSVLVYAVIALLVVLLVTQSIAAVSGIIQWLPRVYENKLHPFVTTVYAWFVRTVSLMDPALVSALEMFLDGALSALKGFVSTLSGGAVNLVSGIATGIPNLILSLLTMIFTTIFLVGDYEVIVSFASAHIPLGVKRLLGNIRVYLTDTLFVVIRSYALIMLLTFTELSILFSVFGIEHPLIKAAVIAVLDIMPVLGTGGIMIPWAVTSLVLGYTGLGLQLFLIYGIVTVVRNYVEPKIVGTQLGLHPIITLVAMFVGLRLFGILGLFGLPVGISFLWKQKNGTEEET